MWNQSSKQSFWNLQQMFRVIIASCNAQTLPHLELSAPAPKVQKNMFLASSSFTIWSIMMKLHKNDQSNKSSIFAQKFCHLRLSALALGLYTCTKSWKIYVKSEFKAILLKLTANVQSDNSFLWCSKFTPFRMYKIMKKIDIKSEFKAVFLKLAPNDLSSKSLLFCLKLTPCISSPCPGGYIIHKILI